MNNSLKASANGDSTGELMINVTSVSDNYPVPDAKVSISYSGEPDSIFEEIQTDSSGNTDIISVPTPPIDYSLEPGLNMPYSEFTINISAEGFKNVIISGSEVLPNIKSIQNVRLVPLQAETGAPDPIVIPAHTLYGIYPPKIAEASVKPIEETGNIVLSRVVVPEIIVVHDGVPTDRTAPDYYVRYKDYIKNVASSEIYATWPQSAIRANILAIMSFTLNRVYTEWYRNKGYNFTITSSTAFDHKWIYGRNIFDTISVIVDEIFDRYLSKPNVKQPILTQYCDGERTKCPEWMSQWGSKYLGDRGYSTIDILRFYYGDEIYINSAEQIAGIPYSWPGYNLDIGSTGQKVLQLQQQLNVISTAYPAIPKLVEDGIYGEATANSVRIFQRVFNLPATGVTDFPTWYKISDIYVGVSRIAELA
ncbi:MAG: peptidoglycan-binding protein [Lachnospiraceae bacterium]|nr:peptidoglycan-binding protein [Lachnospiraceae bacterium]